MAVLWMIRRAALTGLLAAALCSGANAVAPGEPMPVCAALTAVATPAWQGQVLVVDFWASWCPPCRKMMPFLDELHAARGHDGLAIVAVNVDEHRADATRFLERVSVRYPIAYDAAGECPASFDVQAMPSTYLVDRRGVVRHVHHGFRQADRAALSAAVDALLQETVVDD